MKIHQFEIWKARPPGFETDHWFVVVSPQERQQQICSKIKGVFRF